MTGVQLFALCCRTLLCLPAGGTGKLFSKPSRLQISRGRLPLQWLLVPSSHKAQSLCCRCKKQEENYCSKCVLTYNAKDYSGEVTYGGYSTHLVVPEQ